MIRKKLPSTLVQTGPSKRELAEQRNVRLRHAIARMQQNSTQPLNMSVSKAVTWALPKPAPGVVPKDASMAMDAAIDGYGQWAMQSSIFAEGQAFLGYPYLSELTQRPEYRVFSETWAEEMTREWIKFVSTGNTDLEDKTDKIKAIEDAFKKFKIREKIKQCVELDGYFGRAQMYIDLGVDPQNREELKLSIGTGTNALTSAKVRKGKLKGFKVIEPVWTYPNAYNANDPLKADFFKPSTWFVMGQEIHSTRLLTFVGRPVPDLLKPMYSFGGLSLSQMCKPYVDNWLRTRQSVSDAISNYSIMILLTDMASMLNEGATVELETRADFFNVARDNRGLMLADKDSEDIKNVSMPLGGLDHLQAQAQEHQCSVSQIPLVKLTGISPSGLNASSEGELQVMYDKAAARQEYTLRDNLIMILNVVQLHLFGVIDPEITIEFNPLWSADDTEKANNNKTEVDSDVALINAGVVSPQEVRVKIASNKEGPYASLDTSEEALPEAPEDPGQETDENGNPLDAGGEHNEAEGSEAGTQTTEGQKAPVQSGAVSSAPVSQGSHSTVQKRPVTSKPVAQAHDDWNESAHPRGQPENAGEFAPTQGGGAAGGVKKSPSSGKPKGTLSDDSPLLKDSREDQSEEAQQERTAIVMNAFKHAKPVVGRKPIVYIMGGGGGAGKGTLRKQLQDAGEIPTVFQGAVVVDPDEIKMSLKRYKAIADKNDYRASSVVHEDGSEMSKYMMDHARNGKYDVVYDATMSNFEKGLKKIQEFKKAGYDIHMFNVIADPEDAVARAQHRYERTGRYLDPDILREAHKNFSQIVKKYEHVADKFKTYSNYDKLKLERSHEAQQRPEGMPVDEDEVGHSTLNVSWPEKGDDDYGFNRKSETVGSSTQPSIRRALNPIRAQASKLRDRYIEEYSNKAG